MTQTISRDLADDCLLRRLWRWEYAPAPDDPNPAPSAPGDPALRERVEDSLRRGSIADSVRGARSAPLGAAGEAGRIEARAHGWGGQAAAVREIDQELAELYRSLTPPPGGFLAGIRRSDDPPQREAAEGRLRDWIDRAAELRCARGEILDDVASGWGTAGRRELRELLRAAPSPRWHSELERGFVEPHDDDIAQRSIRPDELRGDVKERGRLLTALAGLDDSWGRGQRRVDLTCVVDSDLETPQRLEHPARAALRLPSRPGPADWLAALGSLGRLRRLIFLGSLGRPRQALWGDPGLAAAAGVVFRRLALNSAFREESGKGDDPGFGLELQRLESVDPRRIWTYLGWELDGTTTRLPATGSEAGRDAAPAASFRRSQGRRFEAADLERAIRYSGDPAAELRGWVLALLLEDRWLRRYGRRWFLDRRPAAEMQEIWDGESGQTVESMASALDVGTIEPTPLLDGCRPPRG